MATALLRDTLDLLPQRVPSDCGGNRKKSFFGWQDRRRQCRETSKVARGGAGGEDLGSGAEPNRDLCFNQDGTRRRWKDYTRKNIDDFSGTPKWCFNFMKREGLSLRTWTKLAPKFQQPMRIKFWNFILMLLIFEILTTLSCPKSPIWMRSHSIWCAT